ncbi:MAG: hypothetical protein AB7N76_20430 [Planctomycetota bacterium]
MERPARTLSFILLLGLLAPLASHAGDEGAERDFAVDVDDGLYRVDCKRLKFTRVGRVEVPAKDGGEPERPELCDLAATPDGYLYGITREALYRIDPRRPERSERVGAHGLTNPYGMGAVGEALWANTSGGGVYRLDRRSARATKVGDMGGEWGASGDVAWAGERVVSSVKDAERREHLVVLDPKTGAARLVGRFRTPDGEAVQDVFGLIDRDGVLYALTSHGDVLGVDPATARCTLLRRTKIRWWGATSYVRL